MRKKAGELKTGDMVKIAGKVCKIENIELSDVGKQGTKKCRIEARTKDGEKVVIIRPEDYPFELI
jgi:translation elongation factor P/translation initiation factor 5A